MNPTLSLVTMAMMKKFNKDDAWIWNTYQCYLKANVFHFNGLNTGVDETQNVLTSSDG